MSFVHLVLMPVTLLLASMASVGYDTAKHAKYRR